MPNPQPPTANGSFGLISHTLYLLPVTRADFDAFPGEMQDLGKVLVKVYHHTEIEFVVQWWLETATPDEAADIIFNPAR